MADNMPQPSTSMMDQVASLLNPIDEVPQETETNVTALNQNENEVEQVTNVEENVVNEVSEEDGTEESLKTITELAQYLEIEPEDVYNLQVPMSDGENPLTISEMKDEYIKHIRTQQRFDEERKSFEEERTKHQQEFSQMQAQASSGATAVNEKVIEAEGTLRAITAQFESINWEEAKQHDAGQAAMYRQELQEAYQKASQMKQQAIQEAHTESQKAYQEYATNEWAETVKSIPEWTSQDSLKTDQAEMWETAKEYGISQNEFYRTVDHRLLKLLRDYTKLKVGMKNSDANAKRVRQTGVTLKPRGIKRFAPTKKKALQEKISRAQKSHDMRDQVSAVTDLLNS